MKKFIAWIVKDIDTYLMICDLAKAHGKVSGDDMQTEFNEIREKYPEKFVAITTTSKDSDLLTGELRERGFNILNLNEEERKRKDKND